jgi:hypothetical protein
MGAREAARSVRSRAGTALAIAALLTLGLGACGSEDFANEPRPPSPINLSASVNSKRVQVSPTKVGAGLANFTVANLSADPIRLTLVGPGSDDNPASGEIPPGGVGALQTELREGDYEVGAGGRADVRSDTLTVGPERRNSSNELLQP